jgi:hypothetical protein
LTENGINNESTNEKRKRGPYKTVERLHVIHEIERLLTAGFSSSYIQQQLKLSERTYQRYRQAAFADEKTALLNLSVDFVMESIAQGARQYQNLYDQAVRISEDKTVDAQDRIYALDRAGEFMKQKIFLLYEGPTKVALLKGYPKTIEIINKKMEEKRNCQLRLVKNSRGLPSHYEVVPLLGENNNNNEKNINAQ